MKLGLQAGAEAIGKSALGPSCVLAVVSRGNEHIRRLALHLPEMRGHKSNKQETLCDHDLYELSGEKLGQPFYTRWSWRRRQHAAAL
jgi:hypothetical protein